MVNFNFRVLLVLLLLLSGCAEGPVIRASKPVTAVPPHQKPQPPKVQAPPGDTSRDVFIVKKGDTLYSIGFGSGIGYELLSEWNNIPKPYKLFVGQLIKLYDPALKTGRQPEQGSIAPAIRNIQSSKSVALPIVGIQPLVKPAKPNATIITATPAPPPKAAIVAAHKAPVPAVEISGDSKDKEKALKLYWKWPIQGKIWKNFAQSGNKGIDIEAKVGDPVHAAAKGDVVYSGNGLIGYGNLLIIMHDDLHLSAYANNASLLVNEGQKVTQGQVIARCGKSASGVPSLHFEIRKNGKSVNPLLYLPTP